MGEPGPCPTHLQLTDLCLLTRRPLSPFQLPGRSSAGRGRAVTFPGTATGPEDSSPFGTGDLGDPATFWGRHEPFGVTAGAQSISFKAIASGHHLDWGPLESGRPQPGGAPVHWLLSCWPWSGRWVAPWVVGFCPLPVLCSL